MPSVTPLEEQRGYWNRELPAFDAIYTHEKSGLSRLLDSLFRKDMYERYVETLRACKPVEGRRFLDIGCGTGLYAHELARQGAAHVLGVDIADRMVETCIERAKQEGLENATFVQGSVDDLPADQSYDVSLGIGLFDYIEDAASTLRAMRDRTNGIIIATFPRALTWRAPVRKFRLRLRGCPVYFYRRTALRSLLTQCGLTPVEFRRIGKLYFVVAKT